jgi:hypothetical protein
MIVLRHLRPAARAAAITLSMFGVAMATLVSAESAPLSQQELDWARDALQRNGAFEVVSADAATGWITVRVKSTGELRKVFAGSVVATLPAGAQSTGASGTTAPNTTASTAPGPATASSATSGSEAAAIPAAPKGERVLLSGPGYSIAAAGPAAAGAVQAQAAGASTATGAGAALAGSLPLEHLHEPIICQGSRLYHIDSRNLEFDGDAFSAEDGCELVITNSRIVARGIGIEARGASVHIENSTIEGEVGSIDASAGAQVYASSSTFKGLIRHLDSATFHDMGGNVGD